MDQEDTYAVGFCGDDTFALFFSSVSGVLQFQFIDRVVVILFYVYGFGRPSLEPEVQWGVCGHRSIAEPTVMLFTVLVNGYTIVATAIVVTPYSSSADGPDSAAPMCCRGVCVAMSCGGGGFLVVLTILFGTV